MTRNLPPLPKADAWIADATPVRSAAQPPNRRSEYRRVDHRAVSFNAVPTRRTPNAVDGGLEAELHRMRAACEQGFEERQRLARELAAAQAALELANRELAGSRNDEQRAWHLASHDSLTGLVNRRGFRERLEAALVGVESPGHAFATLYIDLDDFKRINDAYGHEAGDELLGIVAARLGRAVRSDDVVGRIGGDEFACLLTGMSCPQQLELLARKLFDAVAAPVTIGQVRLVVRPSIGISRYPTDGVSADDLLKHADAAMYLAKRRKSGHEFYPGGDAGDPAGTAQGTPLLPWLSRIAAAKRRRPHR